MVQTPKTVALLHRYPAHRIKETNAAFPYLQAKGIDVLTFKSFDRMRKYAQFWKSLLWIVYAPMLVMGKKYDVIYCDDSYPFYAALVKLASPRSKVVLRLGDLHLMYYYSGIIYKFLHWLEKLSWRNVDLLVPISEEMGDYIEDELDISPSMKVILDPVDPTDFEVRATTNPNEVMFHGFLSKNKNVDVLLDAARALPTLDFTIVGDGPDLKRLKKIAPFNVFFTGWVSFSKIAYRIASCAVGVALRSDNPGNEYVVTSPFLQYGVMGKPCLVTRRKVFGDYKWQFGKFDLVSQLQMIFMNRVEEGEKLREFILEHHDARKIADEIWSLLQS